MTKIAIWIQAARPKTLIAGISPVLIGTVMAGSFDLWIFLATLFTGLWIQIGTNLANDYFDFKKGTDTHERIGPTRVTAAGLVSESQMKVAMCTAFILAFVCCFYLIVKGGWIISLLIALAVLLGFGYTAGPISLAYLGIGELFVILFFGVVATGMTAYLQTGVYRAEAFIVGLAPGFLSTAILAINNLRDWVTDGKANKKTIPVRFGEYAGKVEYALMMILPYTIPLLLHRYYYTMAAFLPSIPLILAVFRIKDPRDYIPLLPRTAVILLLYTLFFCVGELL